MSSTEDTIIRGNPFSREYREVLLNLLRSQPNGSSYGLGEASVPPREVFLAKLTDATAIRADRIWKYKWQEHPIGRTSAGGSESTNDYQFFAFNGPEINNAAVGTTGGLIDEATVSFGVKVGDLSSPSSRVTLLPLTHGPDPIVLMLRLPRAVSVTIDGTEYHSQYWVSAANQVSVACT